MTHQFATLTRTFLLPLETADTRQILIIIDYLCSEVATISLSTNDGRVFYPLGLLLSELSSVPLFYSRLWILGPLFLVSTDAADGDHVPWAPLQALGLRIVDTVPCQRKAPDFPVTRDA